MTKLKYIWILFLIPVLAFGAEDRNKKYSTKDFTNKSFLKVPAEEFNNTIIYGSCFFQYLDLDDKAELVKIFPDGITGVTFKFCNLDNVFVPEGNVLVNSINKLIKQQNDNYMWELDKKDKKPKKPISEFEFDKQGWSKDPKDIPKEWKPKEAKDDEELSLNPVN